MAEAGEGLHKILAGSSNLPLSASNKVQKPLPEGVGFGWKPSDAQTRKDIIQADYRDQAIREAVRVTRKPVVESRPPSRGVGIGRGLSDMLGRSWDAVRGVSEVATTVATGLAASIPAGLSGVGELAIGRGGAAAISKIQEVQGRGTYIPRGSYGRGLLEMLGRGLEEIPTAGKPVFKATGSPALATVGEFVDPTIVLGSGFKALGIGVSVGMVKTLKHGRSPLDNLRDVLNKAEEERRDVKVEIAVLRNKLGVEYKSSPKYEALVEKHDNLWDKNLVLSKELREQEAGIGGFIDAAKKADTKYLGPLSNTTSGVRSWDTVMKANIVRFEGMTVSQLNAFAKGQRAKAGNERGTVPGSQRQEAELAEAVIKRREDPTEYLNELRKEYKDIQSKIKGHEALGVSRDYLPNMVKTLGEIERKAIKFKEMVKSVDTAPIVQTGRHTQADGVSDEVVNWLQSRKEQGITRWVVKKDGSTIPLTGVNSRDYRVPDDAVLVDVKGGKPQVLDTGSGVPKAHVEGILARATKNFKE